jgi:uncharacterized protein YpmB
MNIDKLITKLTPIKNFIIRYVVLIFVISVVAILGFMTIMIARYSNAEPTAFQIEDKKASLTAVNLDSDTVEKIEALKSKNINIESLFNNSRDNPFE